MITSRRSLFGFGAALIAAPAIVRVASIMPVKMTYLDLCRRVIVEAASPWDSLTFGDIKYVREMVGGYEVVRVACMPDGWVRITSMELYSSDVHAALA